MITKSYINSCMFKLPFAPNIVTTQIIINDQSVAYFIVIVMSIIIFIQQIHIVRNRQLHTISVLPLQGLTMKLLSLTRIIQHLSSSSLSVRIRYRMDLTRFCSFKIDHKTGFWDNIRVGLNIMMPETIKRVSFQ